MQLENPFPSSVRNLYLYTYSCFNCGRSDLGLELHHILGRISDSAFNACPLCPICHLAEIHTDEDKRRLFNLNQNFLIAESYRPTGKDWQFLRDNPLLVVDNSA